MLPSLRFLARWTKLLLACFALLSAASSQAAVSSACATEVVVVAQGGPPERLPTRTSVRRAPRRPAVDRRPQAWTRPSASHPGPEHHGPRVHLFILHRSLLR